MNNANNNPSNATIRGFAAGHKVASATADGVIAVAHGTKVTTQVVAQGTCGFFAGMKYAIAERRSVQAPKLDNSAAKAAKLKAAQDLYARANAQSECVITVVHLGHKA